MTSDVAGLNLARSIALAVLRYEQGHVGYGGTAGDCSTALLFTGKTVIVECAHAETASSPTRFVVERAVLDLHLDSPVPVYVATPQLTASGRYAVGLRRAESLAGQDTDGIDTEVGPWNRFWQDQSELAPAAAPPAHIASPVELTPDDLADPQLTSWLSADTFELDVPVRHLVDSDGPTDPDDSDKKDLPWAWQMPHSQRRLFHYAWTGDGYQQTETEVMRERLREHLRRVDEARSHPDGTTLVVTRPWWTLRPVSQRLQMMMMLAHVETAATPPWASHVIGPESCDDDDT